MIFVIFPQGPFLFVCAITIRVAIHMLFENVKAHVNTRAEDSMVTTVPLLFCDGVPCVMGSRAFTVQ